jgi:hypothetical protein
MGLFHNFLIAIIKKNPLLKYVQYDIKKYEVVRLYLSPPTRKALRDDLSPHFGQISPALRVTQRFIPMFKRTQNLIMSRTM